MPFEHIYRSYYARQQLRALHQCTYCSKQIHERVKSTQPKNYLLQLVILWRGTGDFNNFPIKGLIKRYYCRDMMFDGQVTEELQSGQNARFVPRIHSNH